MIARLSELTVGEMIVKVGWELKSFGFASEVE